FRELVAASTNYDFLVPCIQPGCLSSLPIQDSFSTNTCAFMEHSPLIALRILDIHSINRHPGIYYSKIKSQTIFNSFMAYLIGNSPIQPGIPTEITADCPTDFLTVNSNLNTTITSMSYTLQTYSSLSFYIGLRSISVIIESNRSVISFRSVNLIEFTNISVLVNYRSVSVNSVSVLVFRFTEPIYRLYN